MRQFDEGDVVRYRSETQPMAVLWQSFEYDIPTVCCTFFVSDKKEQIVRTGPDTLELVPPQVLGRLQHKKNQTGLKSLFENHPFPVYISVAVVTFAIGFGIPGILQKNANQELLTRGTDVLRSDIRDIISKNYVHKTLYGSALNEKFDLKALVARYSQDSNTNLRQQFLASSDRRDRNLAGIHGIRARNSPIAWPNPNKSIPISNENQDALDQISKLNTEVSVVYGEM